jgi:hypothetical protein
MSHQTSGTILNSLLDTFDPESEHYHGVRDHFTTHELERIDEMRLDYPDDHHFTLGERLFLCYAFLKVLMTAENPS